MSNYVSYENIVKDIRKFRAAGGRRRIDEFNFFDVPGHKYFKIFFYFQNGDSDHNESIADSSGLLAPTWLTNYEGGGINDSNYYMHNSAWSYLKMNHEDERADLLEQFIVLLSNINVESPWYFSEILGLDNAIERTQTNSRDFIFDEQRKKISIKCLHDSFDDRLGTLLDLYRAVVWSWTHKKEILPSNLRKFDMGIYIFETPTTGFSMDYVYPFILEKQREDEKYYTVANLFGEQKDKFDEYAERIGSWLKPKSKDSSDVKVTDENAGKVQPFPKNDEEWDDPIENKQFIGYGSMSHSPNSYGAMGSCKYIEFHNCEIDYNSSKGNYATISNSEGLNPEYTIDIYFDECYEMRNNEFLLRRIGDFVIQDLYGVPNETENGADEGGEEEQTNNYSNDEEYKQILKDKVSYFDKGYGYEKVWELTQKNRITVAPPDKVGLGDKLLGQLKGLALNAGSYFINRLKLGNLYTISPSRLVDQYNSVKGGNVWAAVRAAGDYVEHFSSDKNEVKYVDSIGNIGQRGENQTTNTKYVNSIGNLYKAQTIANNI